MEFEYDPDKSLSNKEKHGIDFEEAQELWSDKVIRLHLPFSSETRWGDIGKIQGKYWTAIVTQREDRIRIISVRRARGKEIDYYEQH